MFIVNQVMLEYFEIKVEMEKVDDIGQNKDNKSAVFHSGNRRDFRGYSKESKVECIGERWGLLIQTPPDKRRT